MLPAILLSNLDRLPTKQMQFAGSRIVDRPAALMMRKFRKRVAVFLEGDFIEHWRRLSAH